MLHPEKLPLGLQILQIEGTHMLLPLGSTCIPNLLCYIKQCHPRHCNFLTKYELVPKTIHCPANNYVNYMHFSWPHSTTKLCILWVQSSYHVGVTDWKVHSNEMWDTCLPIKPAEVVLQKQKCFSRWLCLLAFTFSAEKASVHMLLISCEYTPTIHISTCQEPCFLLPIIPKLSTKPELQW